MNRKAEMAVRTAKAFGKSWGFSISAINVGNRICGTQRKVMFRTAFIQLIQVVPGRGNGYVLTAPAAG